ncbi:uncharacterized protein PITG_14483 [Phytophthora infestans T30-4]|uniref:Glycosyltransferase 61 catalytic domain-containing protein n=1 Tax=Phytophthora infestans (strain T30-4) TaxID=403677 RepID=D0NPY8_PHYIT|nr:uncharacterized protein PITG_14483 [Phytophthora infestans T30-4]EEY62700.1 conserved hypothetical protein [Phytophthora infestans T30-4]|eukprot:XP_002898942.1 conserved hypothetical protein [Phytophthora infestans T30-4]
MVAHTLMKPVPGNSSAAARSKRRHCIWGVMVSVITLVSFHNFCKSFESFQSSGDVGSAESLDTKRLQMYPFGIPHYQKAVHHLVQEEEKVEPAKWTPSKGSKDECLYARDYGLIQRLRNTSRSFCTQGGNSSSPYTFYHVSDAGVSATLLENFVLDVRGAQVAKDIDSLADDGGNHDPRFKYMKNATFCSCSQPQDHAHGAPNIWNEFFVGGPGDNDPTCKTDTVDRAVDDTMTLKQAVVLVRRDDHNPFFQISGILNAWIMVQTIGWERDSTQLVTFDRALPTPVDELRHALLGPERLIISGEEFQHRVVHFESALLAPYEVTGPLMSHLDDNQPCYDNAMIKEFRDLALKSLRVAPRDGKSDPQRCLVTVISRRPYGGRRVQRQWRNEAEILQRMREEYQDAYRFGECEFQSLELTSMTMHDQMKSMLDSDVVIGMHGAGMVNAMWTRPGTLVIEIFPRRRFRWGYRNICQFVGCKWHDFRRGRDIKIHTTLSTDMDKIIPYPEWKSFFDPLFQNVVDELEWKVKKLS